MRRDNSIPIRADPEFKRFLKDIKIEKLKMGKNDKMLSDRKLTEALPKVPNLKKYIIDLDISDEK